MKESGIYVTLTNRVRGINEKNNHFNSVFIHFFCGIYLALGLCGILFVLTDTIGLKVNIGQMVGMILAVSTGTTLLLSNRVWKLAGLLLLILGTLGYVIIARQQIFLGLSYIKECIGMQFDHYFLGIPLGNAAELADANQVLMALALLGLLLAIVLGISIFIWNMLFVSVILFLIVDILCLVAGLMPSARAVVLQLFSLLGISILNACSNKQPMFSLATRVKSGVQLRSKIQLQMSVLLLALAAIVVWISSAFLLEPAYHKVQEVREQSNVIKQKIQEFALEDWKEFDFSPFKRGNMGINGGELGDYRSVSSKHQVDLKITSDVDFAGTVFIKGFAAGLYAGDRWEQVALQDWAKTYYGGTAEWKVTDDTYMAPEYSNLSRFSSGDEYKDRITLSNAMQVSIENAQTKYSYLPGFAQASHFGMTMPVYGWAEGIGRNASYVTALINPVKLLEQSGTVAGGRLDGQTDLFQLTDGETTVQVDYEQFVRDNYLQVPAQVLDEVRADWESRMPVHSAPDTYMSVARRVAAYLKETAEYSLNPGKTPGDKDFVAYFLQEQKAGYCVHFASAGVMLFRMSGIPARYVEGYTVSNLQAGVTKDIEDSKAHAWVEIYVSGFGWIPVDVTPGSNGTEELLNGTGETLPEGEDTDPAEGTSEAEMGSDADVSETEEGLGESGTDVQEVPDESGTITETKPFPQGGISDGQNEENEGSSGTIPGSSGRIGTRLFRTVGMILLAVVLYFVLRYLIRRRSRYLMNYRTAQMQQNRCRRAILCAYRYTENLSGGAGRLMHIDMTGEQLKQYYPEIKAEEFQRWKQIVEETYFSNHAMTEEDRTAVIDIYQAVYEETLKARKADGTESVHKGRIKQFIRKWISCYPSMRDII